ALAIADVVQLEQVAAPCEVLVTRHELDASCFEAGERLTQRESGDVTAAGRGSARGFDRVAQIHQQLLVLPSHDVVSWLRLERRRLERSCDRVRRAIDARRVLADVE